MIGRSLHIPLLATLVLLSACQRRAVEGVATNVQGETLAGVVVQVDGGGRQVTTDVLGHYRVSADSAAARLTFSKSGYATAELILGSEADGRRNANVQLWQLPLNAGVYFFEAGRYRPLEWVLPGQYFMKDGSVAYGTQRPAETRTPANTPFVVCYRTPRYDAQLSRLVESTATRPAVETGSFDVWVEAGSFRADLTAIDTPDAQLLRLQIGQALEPGTYAVHWGALEGYDTLEARVYLFEVAEPPGEHTE